MINSDGTISFTKVAMEHGWMGNMSPHPVNHLGKDWRTSEALFQALRFDDDGIREAIRESKSPMSAKMIAKSNADKRTVAPLSVDDLENMRMCLRLKFDQHPLLRTSLRATGQALLVEDCSFRSPSPWGMVRVPDHANEGKLKWVGSNYLGNLLMELRERYVLGI